MPDLADTTATAVSVSFRKKDDDCAAFNCFAHAIHAARCSESAATINEDRAGGTCQPSKQWPACDIALRHKNTWCDRTQHKHVEVAQMIAHEQTTSWCRTVGPQMNAENAKGETTPSA